MNPFLSIMSAPSVNLGLQPAKPQDLVPLYGTYQDAKEFAEDPTPFNAAMTLWGAVNDAIFLLTKNGGLRRLSQAGKQYVKSTARRNALQIRNPRAVARVSQENARRNEALNIAGREIAKNKKQDFVVESVDNTFQDYFNSILPPMWHNK